MIHSSIHRFIAVLLFTQAVLLAGFVSPQEVAEFQAMMNEMGATMFRVGAGRMPRLLPSIRSMYPHSTCTRMNSLYYVNSLSW